MLSGLTARLRALLLPARTGDEMDEELAFHLEAEIERNVARGMDRNAAMLAARRAFGNVTGHKEAMRDAASFRWLEQTMQDVRFAMRSFSRSATFAITVVATIALALGLNTTAFTLFNAYVLRPLEVRDPYSLYQFNYHDKRGSWRGLTADEYGDLHRMRGGESFA